MDNSNKTLCVVNPASANGRTKKTWRGLKSFLRGQGLEFDVRYTAKPKDATNITREALQNGYRRIIAVGGDGTLNEVVNGFYDNGEKIREDSVFSLIPMGTGGDFARMFPLSAKPQRVLELLTQGEEMEIDVVKGTFTGWNGEKETRYYINVADVGLGSETVYHVNNNTKILRGFLSFLIFAVYSILTYKNKYLTVKVDNKEVFTGKSSMVVASNGSYFGGGMKIAPQAKLNDGLLDITIVKDFSKIEILRNLPGIYSGKHTNHPGLIILNGKKVEIISEEKLYVEFDGESPGMGNLEFEILPLQMKVLI